MYYCRARYYRPAFSRFVAEDLIGLAGGANLYAYVGGKRRAETIGAALSESLKDVMN
ncbi:RHS repeat-associated core domain-containing protein [Burkholderia pyrrocinia]